MKMKKKIALAFVISFLMIFVSCSDGPIDLACEGVVGEKDYSNTSGLLVAGGFLDFIKSDYDKDGHLLAEHVFGSNYNFFQHEYVVYEYNSDGKLLRSVKYCCDLDKPYSEYTMEYEMDSYIVYTHDEQGRAVMGTKYTAKGKLTDITVVLEYYGNGALKSRSFYEDYYLTFLMEYDSLGRCTYQKRIEGSDENVAVLEYDGEVGNVSTIDRVVFDQRVVVSVEYDEAGNIILVNEERDSLDGFVVREFDYYDGTDKIKTYVTNHNGYYEGKGGEVVGDTTTEKIEYLYTDNGCVKGYHWFNSSTNHTTSMSFEYDLVGRLCEVRFERNYDGVVKDPWNILYEYDENGNMVGAVHSMYYLEGGGFSSGHVYEYEYDANGNKTEEMRWHVEESGKRVLTSEIYSEYDDRGNQIWTSFKYYQNDGTQYEGGHTQRSFDSSGNCIKEVRSRDTLHSPETEEWRYDEKGNKVWSSYSYKGYNGQDIFFETTYSVRGYQKNYTETITESNGDGVRSVYEIKYNNLGERVDSTYTKYDANGIVIYSGKYPDTKG